MQLVVGQGVAPAQAHQVDAFAHVGDLAEVLGPAGIDVEESDKPLRLGHGR